MGCPIYWPGEECSGRGTCDNLTLTCVCEPGFTGVTDWYFKNDVCQIHVDSYLSFWKVIFISTIAVMIFQLILVYREIQYGKHFRKAKKKTIFQETRCLLLLSGLLTLTFVMILSSAKSRNVNRLIGQDPMVTGIACCCSISWWIQAGYNLEHIWLATVTRYENKVVKVPIKKTSIVAAVFLTFVCPMAVLYYVQDKSMYTDITLISFVLLLECLQIYVALTTIWWMGRLITQLDFLRTSGNNPGVDALEAKCKKIHAFMKQNIVGSAMTHIGFAVWPWLRSFFPYYFAFLVFQGHVVQVCINLLLWKPKNRYKGPSTKVDPTVLAESSNAPRSGKAINALVSGPIKLFPIG